MTESSCNCDNCPYQQEEIPALEARLLASEQLNAELARMLKSVEWSAGDHGDRCPGCNRSRYVQGHSPDCALAALLKKARTE